MLVLTRKPEQAIIIDGNITVRILSVDHDRVKIVVREQVVAEHARSFKVGDKVINPLHVLPLLERKSRAVGEATAIRQ